MKARFVAVAILLLNTLCSCRDSSPAGAHAPANATEAASICRAIWSPERKISSRDGVLCSEVETTDPSTAAIFVSLLKADKIDWVVIASLGGDVGSALDMAEAVYESGASLVVNGPCLSSCANYIFVAARRKYVIPGGVAGWHGGIPEAPKDGADPAAPLIARSRAFISNVGVDPALFEAYPADMKGWSEFVRAVDEGKIPFWSYPRSELKERFSVRGIIDYWFPDCDDWDWKMQKIGVPYLFRAGRCD